MKKLVVSFIPVVIFIITAVSNGANLPMELISGWNINDIRPGSRFLPFFLGILYFQVI
jgi:hypothetical protein